MTAPRLYVDSADVERVGALLASGVVRGVTTNPTILERGGRTAALGAGQSRFATSMFTGM